MFLYDGIAISDSNTDCFFFKRKEAGGKNYYVKLYTGDVEMEIYISLDLKSC